MGSVGPWRPHQWHHDDREADDDERRDGACVHAGDDGPRDGCSEHGRGEQCPWSGEGRENRAARDDECGERMVYAHGGDVGAGRGRVAGEAPVDEGHPDHERRAREGKDGEEREAGLVPTTSPESHEHHRADAERAEGKGRVAERERAEGKPCADPSRDRVAEHEGAGFGDGHDEECEEREVDHPGRRRACEHEEPPQRDQCSRDHRWRRFEPSRDPAMRARDGETYGERRHGREGDDDDRVE